MREGNIVYKAKSAGGGGSSPLSVKGDIYVHDGTSDTRLPAPASTEDGAHLVADDSATEGVKWVRHSPIYYTLFSRHSDAQLTDMPSALSWYRNQQWNSIFFSDLTNYTQARIMMIKRQNVSTTGGVIRLLYRLLSAGIDGTISNYSQLGDTGHVEVSLNTAQNTAQDSGWIDITDTAKAEVLFALATINGDDGPTDPKHSRLNVMFR